MSFFKDVWQDLVDKRLWPVALVLLLAVVAVPVAIGVTGGSDEPVAPNVIAESGVATGNAVVQPAPAGDGAAVVRQGKLVDPFKANPKAKDEATGGAKAGTDVQATGKTGVAVGGSVGADSGKTVAPTTPSTTPKAEAKPKADTKTKAEEKPDTTVLDLHKVTIRFSAGTEKREIADLAPLAPLGRKDDPVLVFLGVKEDGRTLRFLLSSDVVADPSATCKPSKAVCEVVEAKAGDLVVFGRIDDEGNPERYALRVVSVRRNGSTPPRATTAKARAAAASKRKERRANARRAAFTYAVDALGLTEQFEAKAKLEAKYSLTDANG